MPPPLKQPWRGRVYAALQRLRGHPVGRFVRQLQAWEKLPLPEFDRLNAERLRRMLAHARAHVPLYRTGRWATALAGTDAGLAAWPVLEREVLRARAEELCADPLPRRIVTKRTSGSTGKPVKIPWTREAETWWWAHRYRALFWHGIPIGVSSLRLSQHDHALRDWLLGQRCVPVLHAPGGIDKAVQFLVENQPPLVMGPPSALFYLARGLRERGIRRPVVPFARVGGEQLYDFQRAEIEQCLGARVINAYGSTEIGAIASECPAGSLHLSAEHVHCEIFNGDAVAGPGELGDIVLTASHNPAMPLIRYRVGDRGRLSPQPCRCGLPHPVLMDIQARAADAFPAADGSLRHGSEFLSRMGSFFADPAADAVRQFQFVQTGRREWRVLVEIRPPGSLSAAAAARLADIVRKVCGAECAVETQVVDWIRRERGKYSYYRVEREPQPAPRAA